MPLQSVRALHSHGGLVYLLASLPPTDEDIAARTKREPWMGKHANVSS